MRVSKARNRTIVHETPEKNRIETHHFVSDVVRDQIAKKAYELFQGRGCAHGRDIEDWLEAERLVTGQKG